jgi:hypothetical protein
VLIGCAHTSGSGHVLDHNGWNVRNMTTHVAGDDAGVMIVAAAYVKPDD